MQKSTVLQYLDFPQNNALQADYKYNRSTPHQSQKEKGSFPRIGEGQTHQVHL